MADCVRASMGHVLKRNQNLHEADHLVQPDLRREQRGKRQDDENRQRSS